jgi:peptidoglycan/LPS O-acetylase OafA/YrhL
MMQKPVAVKSHRIHLHFLDGFRGLAALYVAFYHLNMIALHSLGTFYPASTHPLLKRAFEFLHITVFNHGHYAVVAFIVLSGFCLMLPMARSCPADAVFDLKTFISRRGKRILPPYYFSVLFALAVIALVPGMDVKTGAAWDLQLPAFTPGVLLSHLFLIHNLHMDWALRINSPLWSVALEWQIYFIFGLILIPIWRRYGTVRALASACLLGTRSYLPHLAWEWRQRSSRFNPSARGRRCVSACPGPAI